MHNKWMISPPRSSYESVLFLDAQITAHLWCLSLIAPRPSFLPVPPSYMFLFLPLPALSQSLRIHKRPFFIDFDESVTDRRTDGRTDQPTDGQGLL